jgi:hypothetical protein
LSPPLSRSGPRPSAALQPALSARWCDNANEGIGSTLSGRNEYGRESVGRAYGVCDDGDFSTPAKRKNRGEDENFCTNSVRSLMYISCVLLYLEKCPSCTFRPLPPPLSSCTVLSNVGPIPDEHFCEAAVRRPATWPRHQRLRFTTVSTGRILVSTGRPSGLKRYFRVESAHTAYCLQRCSSNWSLNNSSASELGPAGQSWMSPGAGLSKRHSARS